jgi:hypothetical protein
MAYAFLKQIFYAWKKNSNFNTLRRYTRKFQYYFSLTYTLVKNVDWGNTYLVPTHTVRVILQQHFGSVLFITYCLMPLQSKDSWPSMVYISEHFTPGSSKVLCSRQQLFNHECWTLSEWYYLLIITPVPSLLVPSFLNLRGKVQLTFSVWTNRSEGNVSCLVAIGNFVEDFAHKFATLGLKDSGLANKCWPLQYAWLHAVRPFSWDLILIALNICALSTS